MALSDVGSGSNFNAEILLQYPDRENFPSG
jgi:hypothetical protein